MTLEELLKELQSLVELKHPLEVLAKLDVLVQVLHKQIRYYKGTDPSKRLEYRCLVASHKSLTLFLSDLNEWNLSRRTERVSTEAYLESSFGFLHNLIETIETDLKYVKKLREPSKKERTFFQKYLLKNKQE